MKTLMIIGVIVIILVVWGLVGSSISSDVGTSCDIGIGEGGSALCWTWHRNAVGDFQDGWDDLINK